MMQLFTCFKFQNSFISLKEGKNPNQQQQKNQAKTTISDFEV